MLPPGCKNNSFLFGKAQVCPEKALNNQEQARKRDQEDRLAEDEDQNSKSDSESEEETKFKKEGSRKTWGNQIDLRFGTWIEEIPYKDGGTVGYTIDTCHQGVGCQPHKARQISSI